jgi:hypothetical protein
MIREREWTVMPEPNQIDRQLLGDDRAVTVELAASAICDELARVKGEVGMKQYRAYRRAAELSGEPVREEKFTEFLTVAGYSRVFERSTISYKRTGRQSLSPSVQIARKLQK